MAPQDPFEAYKPNESSGIKDNKAPDAPKQSKATWKPNLFPPDAKTIRIVGVIAVICLVLELIAIFFLSLWVMPSAPSPERTIATSTITPTADILSRIDKAFGPWTIVKTGVEAPGRVVLIDNGGAMKAGKQFSGDASWQVATTPFITDKTINLSKGTITFRLSTTVTVTVLANQVFILRETPELVYMYRDGGNLVSKPIGV